MRDYDAANDGGMNSLGKFVSEQVRARGIAPTPVKDEAEQDDIEPIHQQRGAEVNELGERAVENGTSATAQRNAR